MGWKSLKNKLPILPETLDICRAFDINPLGLISSGSLLICAPKGDKVVAELKANGIPATIIGKVTEKLGDFSLHLKERNPSYP